MEKSYNAVLLPQKKTIQVSCNSRIIDIIDSEDLNNTEKPVIAAKFNNIYTSLNSSIAIDGEIELVRLEGINGMRIYRDSLIFLFEMAARKLFPGRRIVIGHSLGHGFILRFRDNGKDACNEDIEKINREMNDTVKKDLPVMPDKLSWKAAIDYFGKRAFPNTADLLNELNEPEVDIWKCGSFISLRQSTLVYRTGLLKTFALENYQNGFLLRYPPTMTPGQLSPHENEPKLFSVYEEYKKWGEILGVSNVSQLNVLSRNRSKARDFIQTAEALHDRKIAECTGIIRKHGGEIKAVMIAGPSSSGKTTFLKKLALSLRSAGFKPQLISLDNYYKNHDEVPKDEDGKPDFEALEALDLDLFNKNLEDLFAGKETEIPVFDFKNVGGRLEQGYKIRLEDDGILLFEGIHGLNPDLAPHMDRNKSFRIYISPLTQLNLDDFNRIPTTDNRLIRRIVRDHQFRRYSAVKTLKIWPSVRRGEKKHIFPYRNTADILFNSALDYEMAILKIFAEPLLRTVKPDEEEYSEAQRLISLLKNFSPFPVEEVPEYSIIREFIGRSGFRY